MDWFMFSTFIAVGMGALILALAGLLIYAFIRTRNPGFLWITAAFVVWPRIAAIADRSINRSIVSGKPPAGFLAHFQSWSGMSLGSLFYFIESIQALIGAAMMIIAVLYLVRRTDRRTLVLAS